MTPSISIIVPIYNTNLEYVEDCLKSVVSQSYPHKRLEIIVYDEGSSKNYSNNLNKLLNNIETIHVSRLGNEKKTSLAHSRNEAIDIASGNYIMLLDSDDFLHPEAVSRCVQKFEYNIDFVYTNHIKISSRKEGIIHYRDKRIYQDILLKYKNTIFNPFLYATFVFHCQMFKRTIFDKVGKFREDLLFGEEVDFHLKVDELCNHNNFNLVPDYLYYYRDNPNSICHQQIDYSKLINNISYILKEGAQRRGFDVKKAIRVGRARPTNAAHYALYDSEDNLLELPYFDFDKLEVSID